jgi:hypothetical protein
MSADFALPRMLIQLAIAILQYTTIGSALNIAFACETFYSTGVQAIMHPGSPMTASGPLSTHAFPVPIPFTCLLAGWSLASWFQIQIADPRCRP